MSYQFWEIISKAKSLSNNDIYLRPESLKQVLNKLSPVDIESFNVEYRQKLVETYRWDLWGAAYLINGGCSDDGFDYFRDFLISEGEQVYKQALENPDSLAELEYEDEIELEDFRYAIDDAYTEKTGASLPQPNLQQPDNPAGESWDEDELPQLFPKLAGKFC
ncbi:DUF4240 domain-containing protein [Sessilibacter corallicola]|uniref:DUF4240 domain-containing protein n=1 Tax=Sessilibacter corallicola TaxID=2904075 RepID=UPI001E474FB2|nr:DUF4240 domain-containing protein [Sessilibacter corallicola]MCE2030022.1 DUF4240 domain-containing protein [Sessilibacter corallicola]